MVISHLRYDKFMNERRVHYKWENFTTIVWREIKR